MPRLVDAALDGPFGMEEGAGAQHGRTWAGSIGYPKRAMDIILSLLALCFVLSWLLPLLCLLILIDIGAPVFFIQERIGRQERPFRCIKLRTLRKPEAGHKHRITRLGKWLRNHKLDEIPQFINVLKGEMSIVGPRPHMLSDHQAFSQILGAEYKQRHAVLPGITGLAQVSGYEGPIASRQRLRGRVRLDLFYIQHWSAALEFLIMYRTISLFFAGVLKFSRKAKQLNSK